MAINECVLAQDGSLDDMRYHLSFLQIRINNLSQEKYILMLSIHQGTQCIIVTVKTLMWYLPNEAFERTLPKNLTKGMTNSHA